MPRVTLKLYTLFRAAAGTGQLELELPPGSRVFDVLEYVCRQLGQGFRELVWDAKSGEVLPFLLSVNGRVEPSMGGVLENMVEDGDTIALMDPVGGGDSVFTVGDPRSP